MGDENIREQDDQVTGGAKWKDNERGILLEGAIIGRGRNMVLGQFPRMHKNDLS